MKIGTRANYFCVKIFVEVVPLTIFGHVAVTTLVLWHYLCELSLLYDPCTT